MQRIWYHGTNRYNSSLIQKEGFREGTWFARHMEDAVEFGGPIVFAVRVVFRQVPMKWQVCASTAISSDRITKKYIVKVSKQPR